MNTQAYYNTLGLPRNASAAEVKKAYRRLAHRFHPDVTRDRDGERKFKAVANAYRMLIGPKICAPCADVPAAGAQRDLSWLSNPFALWFAWWQWNGCAWMESNR